MMERAIRTFKLRVSPEGFEIFACCHQRLMVATMTLNPYGATLTAAMEWLDLDEARQSSLAVPRRLIADLSGPITLFVGAPRWISSRATDFSRNLERPGSWGGKVSIGEVYLLALYGFSKAPLAKVEMAAEPVGAMDDRQS